MRRILLTACAGLALMLSWHGLFTPAEAQVPGPAPGGLGMEPPRFPDFNTVMRGAKTLEGFFKLHHKEDKLYCEILPQQFNQPWLCSISVARGGGLGGFMLNFQEEWVLSFRREGDRVFLIRRNVHYKASGGTPVAKAVETTYSDSILMALRIVTINQMTQGVVINLNDIFMTDFAQLGMGMFDASRSSWHKIKTFPHNNELQVEATFAGRSGRGGTVIDGRGNTMLIHYGMVQLPDGGYQPRIADDRVGYFLTAVKDFSKDSKETSFVRYVRRWRLEPSEAIDPKNPAKLVAPKKKIVYWIEKSVPNEYRAYVREGILEWNKAFEKIGFRDAIEVRQQDDSDPSSDFDPEDVRYNTFRWITLDAGFAMGPSRANPLTGELIDADIIFDASMIRYWKEEYKDFTATGEALESPSAIRDGRMGIGILEQPLFQRQLAQEGWNEKPKSARELHELRMQAIQSGFCQCCSQKKYEIGLGAMALAARGVMKPGDKVPDELIGQAIKETVMHEVGHTLGLRHNFKASTMLKNEQLNDTAVTRKQGLVGSVMDYNPINIAPKGVKQGDFFTSTIGPYDYWAIEYAYKPLQGNQEEELAKIGSKIAQPGHEYGTDEDLFLNSDPDINVWDLGSDPMKFGQDRMLLAEELLKDLHNRIVGKGEGYQRARVALGLLLRQFGDAAFLTAQHVGGEYAHRDHKDDPNGRDPLVPVACAKQRDALKFLQEHILSEKSFQFSPELLRKLAVERWSHWGAGMGSPDYSLYDRLLGIQRIVLSRLLDPATLNRIQNNCLKTAKDEQPLQMAEVFRSLTDGVWNGTNPASADGKRTVASSVIRRNLQREHIKDLSSLVLGRRTGSSGLSLFGDDFSFGSTSAAPPDARSLARMHLREVGKKIEATLNDKGATVDETTRAHLEECQERIAKVLNASMQVSD
jgi:hypothetical protein